MKLDLKESEWMQVIVALSEKKNKHLNLSAVAGARINKTKFIRNAEKLRTEHKSTAESSQNLITKIVEQL